MKLALIGTGRIIGDALYAMEPVAGIEKVAIWARNNVARARELADKYGIPAVYTDYTRLLTESGADTVYIGLVNSVHYAYAREALLRGKHVILEKPFTAFAREAEELRTIAAERGLFLLEAVNVLHSDVFDHMRQRLPDLGPVRMVTANFSQYSSRYDGYLAGKIDPCFDPALCGGSLYDINVYNVHFCVGLFGAPREAVYYPNRGHNGIDTSGALILRYPDFVAVCSGAKDSDSPGFVCIQGEKGWLRLDGKPNTGDTVTTLCSGACGSENQRDASGAVVRTAAREDWTAPKRHHRMTREFMDFAALINAGDVSAAAGLTDEAVTVCRVLEQARLSAGIVF